METAQRELNQAQKALEKSELECQRLSGDYSEARRRANFSEKKSAALQAALDAYCPKLSSLAEMIRFYETVSPSLDPQGFTLFRAAKKMTGIDLYSYFAYEDSRGLFEQMDGRQLLRWLTAARFGAVEWEIVTGRPSCGRWIPPRRSIWRLSGSCTGRSWSAWVSGTCLPRRKLKNLKKQR